jgi:hypothetical protein
MRCASQGRLAKSWTAKSFLSQKQISRQERFMKGVIKKCPFNLQEFIHPPSSPWFIPYNSRRLQQGWLKI